MQRTVKGTIYTYAETRLDEWGNVTAELKTVKVSESDPKAAKRSAKKIVGYDFQPLKTETFTKLYKLDDEIFFKYAVAVEDAEE